MVNDTLSRVALLAQKYTEDVPVIILGSGATIPFGLPSMTQLADALVSQLKPEKADKEKWVEFMGDLKDTQDLEKSLHNINISESLLTMIVIQTWKIIKEKDFELLKDISTCRTKLPLTELLTYLLRTANPHITIITTNYDRMAECAADLAQASAHTGFTEGHLQSFATSVTRTQNKIDIWKVHGSLDWFLRPDGQIVKLPFDNILEGFTPLIVTPGIDKYRRVHKDPFRTVLTKADLALNNAKCYLCIGYGFNDEHVQPVLIRRSKNENIPLVVITKQITPIAKQMLVSGDLQKFLFIEEGDRGSTVYSDEFPDGIAVKSDAWKLEGFMNLIVS